MEPVKSEIKLCSTVSARASSGEEMGSMEGFTFDTRVEDLRHVWIPLSLKMSISKNQGLEINSWSEGEEVSREHFVGSKLPISSRCVR